MPLWVITCDTEGKLGDYKDYLSTSTRVSSTRVSLWTSVLQFWRNGKILILRNRLMICSYIMWRNSLRCVLLNKILIYNVAQLPKICNIK